MRFPRLSQFPRKLLLIPPIAIGVVGLALAASSKRSLQQEAVVEQPRTLRVVMVEQRQVQPQVVGYGLARPSRTWRAVARVDGTVLETHPNLNAGAWVSQGVVLVRIDPTDYQLQFDQLGADADALKAQISEIEAARENDQATLKLEEQSLALFHRELDRQRRLQEQRAVSKSGLEQAERNMLLQQRSVQMLKNSLNLVPSKLDRLRASQLAVQKRLEAAQRDLERTVIKAPFDCRLASVTIESGQYVATNEQLFEVHGITAMEVEARLPIEDFPKLVPPGTNSVEDGQQQPMEDFFYGLSATVRVNSGTYTREWPAELVRIREQVDPRTRTLGVVVEVQHLDAPRSVEYPPLLEGVFCHVEFAGRPRPDQLLVPIAAVHNHALFVVNKESRLERRAVQTIVAVGDKVVVQGNLSPGERVVVGNPAPAVEGALVKAVLAPQTPTTRIAAVKRMTP